MRFWLKACNSYQKTITKPLSYAEETWSGEKNGIVALP